MQHAQFDSNWLTWGTDNTSKLVAFGVRDGMLVFGRSDGYRTAVFAAPFDGGRAIPLAERAVEKSPRDAGFRALLGNCYLAGGRFASAEAASFFTAIPSP